MILENCREKVIKPRFANTKGGREMGEVENPYWEGNLKPEDKRFIDGYDCAVEEVLRTAFCNIEMMAEEFSLATGKSTNTIYKASEVLGGYIAEIDELRKTNKGDSEAEEDRFLYFVENGKTKLARIAAVMLACLEMDFEMSRNEIITSMIEGYGDEDSE